MMTMDLAGIPSGSLPIDAFKAHLRLAEGFDVIPGQMERLRACLRAAIVTLEARVSKIFLRRDFIVRTCGWTSRDHFGFALAPIVKIDSVKIVYPGGEEVLLDSGDYGLAGDRHRPRLVARGGVLPALNGGAVAEVAVEAGFASAWPDVPADIGQAVFILAESYFETVGPMGKGGQAVPAAVSLLVAPYRTPGLRSPGGVR